MEPFIPVHRTGYSGKFFIKMKRVLSVTLLIICLSINFAFAGTSDSSKPLTGTEWEGKSAEQIFFGSFEKAFIDLYKVTEKNPAIIKAFKAFGMMKTIVEMKGLDKRYKENRIDDEELQKLLEKILAKIKSPKTAKDYFYKGLFAYAPEPWVTTINNEMYNNFEYVIETYPNSIYAKYSYIFLSDNYKKNGYAIKAIDALKKFIAIYSEKDELTYIVYYRLSVVYNLGFAKEKNMDVMLEYSHKIINEFPEKKIVGSALLNLGYYYLFYPKDYDKAEEYFLKVYNNSEYNLQSIYRAVQMLVKIYKKKGDYIEAEKLLEKMKLRYAQAKRRDLFNPGLFREFYKEAKLNLEEIKRYGYDSEEYNLGVDRKKYENIYETNNDEIEQYRKEWEEKYLDEWLSHIKVSRINDRTRLILEHSEIPFKYYKQISKNDYYFYEDEQPLELNVIFARETLMGNIAYNDWYNGLRLSVEPHKHLYSYNESGKMIKEKEYTEEHELKKEMKTVGIFKVLKGEDLKDGKLVAGDDKRATIEAYDKNNKPFKSGYFYEVKVGFKLKNGRLIFDWLGNQNHVEFDIIKPVTPDQIKDWTIRKGDREIREKKYQDAVKHYLEVFEKETANKAIRKILYQKLANTYELDEDYNNAKKYLGELLKHVEGEIKVAKDDKNLLPKLQEEKAEIEKKIKEIEGL